MRIAYILYNHNDAGGTERVISQKANALISSFGHEVYIIDICEKKGDPFFNYDPRIRFISLDVDFVSYMSSPIFIKMFRYSYLYSILAYRLKRAVKDIDPDIIISTFNFDYWIVPLIKGRSKTIIENHMVFNYECIGKNFTKKLLNKLRLPFTNFVINRYDQYVLLTKADYSNWKAIKHKTVIYNFITVPAFDLQEKERKVLSIGRLAHQKGFDYLINAWQSVYAQYPNWKLEIVGEGELEEQLRKQIHELGLENGIIMSPFTKDIHLKYAEASVYVMSSRFEGFGLVLAEAMFYGLPCIAFDCESGPREIIDNNKTGILVSTFNVTEMTEQIINLISNESLRNEMGQNAQIEVSKRFSKHEIMEQWNNLFNKIINQY